MSEAVLWLTFANLALLLIIIVAIFRLRSDINRNYFILQRIAGKTGVPEPCEDEELKAYIASGDKIKAVRRYRQITGAGLEEANEYVNKLC